MTSMRWRIALAPSSAERGKAGMGAPLFTRDDGAFSLRRAPTPTRPALRHSLRAFVGPQAGGLLAALLTPRSAGEGADA
jgi:hypothetical protein